MGIAPAALHRGGTSVTAIHALEPVFGPRHRGSRLPDSRLGYDAPFGAPHQDPGCRPARGVRAKGLSGGAFQAPSEPSTPQPLTGRPRAPTAASGCGERPPRRGRSSGLTESLTSNPDGPLSPPPPGRPAASAGSPLQPQAASPGGPARLARPSASASRRQRDPAGRTWLSGLRAPRPVGCAGSWPQRSRLPTTQR